MYGTASLIRRSACAPRALGRTVVCPLPLPCAQRTCQNAQVALQPSHRQLASRAQGEKSWGELAADAADVAKSAFAKLKDSAASVVEGLVKRDKNVSTETRRNVPEYQRPSEFSVPTDLFGPGLMGKVLGGLVGSAVKAVSKQVAESAKESNAAYNHAASVIRNSLKLRNKLGGGVTVGPAVSQAMSTSYINGRSSTVIQLVAPVYSDGGEAAQANISVNESSAGPRTFDIVVRLPNGTNIRIDDGSSGSIDPTGRTIDVDFEEINTK